VQSNYEALNAAKVAMAACKFQGRDDTPKLIEALEGLEMKEGDDFPQGDKTLRKADHQAFLREFLFEVNNQDYKLLATIDKDKTIVPPACSFSA
jgi:branched-chain amino acid transport system substrate-binding protein